MIKIIKEERIIDKFDGKNICDYTYTDPVRIYIIVDDEPYLVADLNGGNRGTPRIFVDWIDRSVLFNNKKIVTSVSENNSWIPNKIFLKPTADEIKLVRLLRKLTKFPNGRVIL